MSKLTIATICARGGSVGVPGKNIRPLGGKPLIVHSIEQALATPGIDHVYVSTDAPDIAEVARAAGAEVPFQRPAHLATSEMGKLPVLEHLVDWVEANVNKVGVLVDLQPTSPLRLPSDISAAMELLDDTTNIVITGYEADKNPYYDMIEYALDGSVKLVKQTPSAIVARQRAPKVFAMNGSIYVWRREYLSDGVWNNRPRLYIMPRDRSVDIDEPIDFDIAELMISKRTDGR